MRIFVIQTEEDLRMLDIIEKFNLKEGTITELIEEYHSETIKDLLNKITCLKVHLGKIGEIDGE